MRSGMGCERLEGRGFAAALAICIAQGLIPATAAPIAQPLDGLEEMLQLPTAVAPVLGQVMPAHPCESLLTTRLSNDAMVRDASIEPGKGSASEWCRVTIEIRSPPAPDIVTVWLVLPIDHWNGRFLGLGGGGWVSGFPAALDAGAALGFATAITNAGLSVDHEEPGRLVRPDGSLLDIDGGLNWTVLENFAYRSVHEMTVVGKAVTRVFYGLAPRYAYFSGCSTGGRQGQSEVQRYPQDYDGVLSGAPAINWAHFAAAQFWPVAVVSELHAVSQCKFNVAHQAAVAACDGDDGVRDGLVSEVGSCHFDAKALVGMGTDCGVIDAQDAEVINRIWDGPRRTDGSRLWNGIDRAALIHSPSSPTHWAEPFFDGKAPDADGLSMAAFEILFDQMVERYAAIMDTANPDLRTFAEHGGKTILWHGVADDTIPAAGTLHYVESIRRTMGQGKTDVFLRLYLAPGVRHCMGGDGPQPVGLLEPLMEWVERGRAPATVRSENRDPAGNVARTRPLCPYPERARYQGRGSLRDAANFRCRR